jgi:putative transposase
MLDRVIEQAREKEIFSREDTPTAQRVEAAFLYHVGLSYRRVEEVVGRSHEAVRQWYHRLAHLFKSEHDHHEMLAVDETKVNVEDTEVYVWAAVDVDTVEVVHIEVSPGRSDLDAHEGDAESEFGRRPTFARRPQLQFGPRLLNRPMRDRNLQIDEKPHNW